MSTAHQNMQLQVLLDLQGNLLEASTPEEVLCAVSQTWTLTPPLSGLVMLDQQGHVICTRLQEKTQGWTRPVRVPAPLEVHWEASTVQWAWMLVPGTRCLLGCGFLTHPSLADLEQVLLGIAGAVGLVLRSQMESQSGGPPQERLEFLQALLTSTQEAVVACSADGTLRYFNEATQKLHGLPLEPIPAEGWAEHYDLYLPDHSRRLKPEEVPLYQALQGKEVRGVEMVIQPRKGAARLVRCYGNQIRQSDGTLQGAVVVMHDITEMKLTHMRMHLQEQVLQTEQKARLQSSRALEQSLALRTIAEHLLQPMEPEALAGVIHTECLKILGTSRAYVFLQDPDSGSVHLLFAAGGTFQDEPLLTYPLDFRVPVTDAIQSGAPVLLPSRQVFLESYPHLAHLPGRFQSPSQAVFPLKTGQGTLGAMYFAFDREVDFTLEERAFMENLAHLVALAVERMQRRDMEQKLVHEKEELIARLEALLDNAPLGIGFLGTDLKYQLVNPLLAAFNGHFEHDHIGQTPVELFGEVGKELERLLQQVLDTKQPLLDLEVSDAALGITHRNNHWLASYFPVTHPRGHLLGVGGTVQDITERKQAEAALQDSQRFLQRIADTAPTVLYLYDLQENRITYANRHLQEAFGYAPEEILGFSTEQVMGLIHPDEMQDNIEHMGRLMGLQDGEVIEREFRVLHKDGSWRHLYSQQAVFSRTPDGTVKLVLTGALDVTERRHTEEQLLQSERQLRHLHETQKRFVADAAHELRNPLTSILGNMDLLVRYPHLEAEDRKEIVADVQREATRLGRLVNDMLQLARGDAGAELREDEVQLHLVLQETTEDLQKQFPDHHYHLGQLEEVMVLGDHDRLRQLCIILLENAGKYTPRGGHITASLVQQDGQVHLQVKDTGVGIAPEHHEKVFERFYRVDRARQRGEDPGGTGLGLPIARWVVEQHGGRIWLESEVGKGTTVHVVLPQGEG